jgi:hypothetical protein
MDKLPCGYDASKLDCIDCCGYKVCEWTKLEDNDSLIKALKDTMGLDINGIKAIFDEGK